MRNNLNLIEESGVIKIYTTDEGIKVVNGRELWEGLGVEKKFTDWIRNNLEAVDAVDSDFFTLKGRSENNRETIEYTLKLEIAKEICMVAGASPRANDELKQRSKDYRKYLISVEEKYKQTKLDTTLLSPELQMLNCLYVATANIELEQKQIKQEIQGIRDVVTLSTTEWRKDSSQLLVGMARKLGGTEHLRILRTESYDLLNERMGVSLQRRLTNRKQKMALEGVCKSKRDKLNNLDIIAEDKKLVEGYVAIIKDMAVKYGVVDKLN